MAERITREDLFKKNPFLIIGGPCAVESKEQIYLIATELHKMGVKALRAPLFKPRKDPDSFQGIGLRGLRWLRQVKEDFGMLIAMEITDRRQIRPTEEVVDIPWVGSDNMGNRELLKALKRHRMKNGEQDKRPIILKRGKAATVDEWLGSANYLGYDRTILCERGVRTGTDSSRYTLDLNGASVARQRSVELGYPMPVIVDPSHPAGKERFLVGVLTLASVAAGVDGVMVEVHNNPADALSDGFQQITPGQFREVLNRARIIRQSLGNFYETVNTA